LTTPVVMWCFPGHRCELPMDQMFNFGGFYGATSTSSAFADGLYYFRIVVTGFSGSYQIRYTKATDTCSPLTKALAPFCEGAGFNKVLMSGDTIWFPNKDAKAQDQFNNFSTSFSCPQGNSCNCGPLTDKCLLYLKELACELTFGPCDSNGFRKQPDYTICQTIEYHCKKSFVTAALPQFMCDHNYYLNGVGFVSAAGAPIHPLPKQIEGRSSTLATGWVIFIGILLFGAILMAAGIALVVIKRSGRHEYSRLGESDYAVDGGGYTQF